MFANRRRPQESSAEAMRAEALARATGNQSVANYAPIIEGFSARGIPADDIRPRENVFTYRAWQALGRQVRKGERGVRVHTFVPAGERESVGADGQVVRRSAMRPVSTVVFHVSQTVPRDNGGAGPAVIPAAPTAADDIPF